MKIKTILLIIITFSFTPSLINAETFRNQYINGEIATSSNYFIDNFKEQEEITKIKYIIDLGRKETSRIILGSINVETIIDVDENITYEKIELNYYQEVIGEKILPNLIGEKIFFTLDEFDDKNYGGANDLSIIGIYAPGWEGNIANNSSSTMSIKCVEQDYFSNRIVILTEIKNQNKYRGRQFEILNRDAVDFKLKININGNYEFTNFNPSLPVNLKPENEIKSFEDYFNLYTDSIIISNQITSNKIYFDGWLKGDKYYGGYSAGNLIPEKGILFNYSYEYQEDVNAKIVEENKKSTEATLKKITSTSEESNNFALLLFGISILVSILSVKFKHIIIFIKFIYNLTIKIVLFIYKIVKNIFTHLLTWLKN